MQAEEMFKVCQKAHELESEKLVSLNWILATIEYPKFVSLMLEFKVKMSLSYS